MGRIRRNAKLAFGITVLLTVAGIVVPVGWDWYNRRVAVEMQLLATNTLVERGAAERLTVAYNGVAVPGLSRIDLRYANVGRTPIRRDDVHRLPQVVVDRGRIIDVRIDSTEASNVAATVTVDSAGIALIIDAPLLNPSDAVRFTVFVAAAPAPGIRVQAHIAGADPLELVERRPGRRSVWRRVPWTIYPASVAIAVLLLVLCLLILVYGEERHLRHSWRLMLDGVLQRTPAGKLASVLPGIVGEHAASDRQIGTIISKAPPGAPLPDASIGDLHEAVDRQVSAMKRWLTQWLFAVGLLLCLGAGYVFWTLVSRLGR